MEEKAKYEIGGIVGRFQVHELHGGHIQMFEKVKANHKKVIVFLGVSRVLGSKRNPLDFGSRKKMIQDKFPDFIVTSLPDCRTNEEWSKNLDSRLKENYPIGSVVLYGNRDSFIPHYTGRFETMELDEEIIISGTEIRKNVSEEICSSKDWRAGVIYSTYNRYSVSYQAVDIAPFNNDRTKLLLAQKPGEDKWRFVGGHVDPTDFSLEHAARREFMEETGRNANIEGLKYVTSCRIDDWRYRSESDKIMSTLFEATYTFGRLEPSDDISALRWFDVDELKDSKNMKKYVVEEHLPMMIELLTKEQN